MKHETSLSFEEIVEKIFPFDKKLESENGSTKKSLKYDNCRFDAHLMAHGIDAFYDELLKCGIIFNESTDKAISSALKKAMKRCKKDIKKVV